MYAHPSVIRSLLQTQLTPAVTPAPTDQKGPPIFNGRFLFLPMYVVQDFFKKRKIQFLLLTDYIGNHLLAYCLVIRSLARPLIRSLAHAPTCSPARSLARSLTLTMTDVSQADVVARLKNTVFLRGCCPSPFTNKSPSPFGKQISFSSN